jgi:hypothetical protein
MIRYIAFSEFLEFALSFVVTPKHKSHFPSFRDRALSFAMFQSTISQIFWNAHSASVGSKTLVQNFWNTTKFLYDQIYSNSRISGICTFFRCDPKTHFSTFRDRPLSFAMRSKVQSTISQIFWNAHSASVGSKTLVQNLWTTTEFL